MRYKTYKFSNKLAGLYRLHVLTVALHNSGSLHHIPFSPKTTTPLCSCAKACLTFSVGCVTGFQKTRETNRQMVFFQSWGAFKPLWQCILCGWWIQCLKKRKVYLKTYPHILREIQIMNTLLNYLLKKMCIYFQLGSLTRSTRRQQ